MLRVCVCVCERERERGGERETINCQLENPLLSRQKIKLSIESHSENIHSPNCEYVRGALTNETS
jgi:hypothetical protein